MKARLVIVVALGTVAMLAMGATPALAGHGAIKARNNWGNATGSVHWSGGPRGTIKIKGVLHDTPANPSNSFLYLRWRALGVDYNKQVAGADNGARTNFNRTYHFGANPGEIQVTVCSQANGGWHCGMPQRF
jgi:hypothetical protein